MAQSAKRLAELLKARSLTIAVAETSAGGLVAPQLPAWAVAELAARDAVVVPGFAPREGPGPTP